MVSVLTKVTVSRVPLLRGSALASARGRRRLLRELRLEELTRKVADQELEDMDPDIRPPSPPPTSAAREHLESAVSPSPVLDVTVFGLQAYRGRAICLQHQWTSKVGPSENTPVFCTTGFPVEA